MTIKINFVLISSLCFVQIQEIIAHLSNLPERPTGGSALLQKNENRALIPAALKAFRDVLYALIFPIYPRDCNV